MRLTKRLMPKNGIFGLPQPHPKWANCVMDLATVAALFGSLAHPYRISPGGKMPHTSPRPTKGTIFQTCERIGPERARNLYVFSHV